MAYPAMISVKQTIQRLLNSSHISVDSWSREILDHAYIQLTSLQEVLRRSDDRITSSKGLHPLEEQIRETLHQFEDSLESHVTDKYLSRSASPTLPLELDLKEVHEDISSFFEAVKNMEKVYNQESDITNTFSEEEDDDDLAANTIPSRSIDPVKMIGQIDTYRELKDHMIRIIRPDEFGYFSFVGLPGTGRSILAKTVYDDIYAVGKERSFDCGAWARIGSIYTHKQILLTIIPQIINNHQLLDSEEDEDKLSTILRSCLEGKRYIIALDDIRDVEILVQLRRSLPEQNNGSLVFITTSLMEVAEFDDRFFTYTLPTLMDQHFAWRYIRSVFFGFDASQEFGEAGKKIGKEFEEAGKKIANNCGGLPVVLARVILILGNMKKTPESWSELAAAQHDRVYMIDDEISEASDVRRYLAEGDYETRAKPLLDFPILVDRVKDNLFPDRLFPKMGISTIYGMPGVGKTTLMKKLFQDHSVLHRFDCHAWLTLGPNYQSKRILVDVLAQIYPNLDRKYLKENAKLLAEKLSCKKCLIMLDDLWSQEPVHHLKMLLPDLMGELMVTTRGLKVGFFGEGEWYKRSRLLDKEESWDLLREKVFSDDIFLCPPQLEIHGKKIAENCEGLPLLIIAVAEALSESEKTVEYWKKAAENEIPVVMNASNEISKTLIPSYEILPQHLRACFLYMGVFPHKHEISKSKLMQMWFVEGFLEPDPSQTVEDYISKCLKELVYVNMVIVRKRASYLEINKSFSLHSVFWHLSFNEAMKNKFFHALNAYSDSSKMQVHRRLCIGRSILLGFQGVSDAIRSNSTLRSFLCTGSPHQYPVPLCLGSRLLRVIDALAIRFYEFPVEVVELIHLRYLALTCNGSLPSSLSKLWNLQFLIVVQQQYLSIQSSDDSPYLPQEIWDMKELKHLQITGGKLPSPYYEALLPNLSHLIDVSVHSCTKRVFKRIPNLEKLGIQIELAPDDNSVSFYWLSNISHLQKLKSLKCVVVNPELGLEVFVPPIPPTLPSTLKKVKLSGLGLPWEYMSMISKLENLEVLKLQCFAFVGQVWEMDHLDLSGLQFLSIEDADLVRWDFEMPCILKMQSLSIRNCYNLEQLPSALPTSLRSIEVLDSHLLAMDWAKQMKEKNWERKIETLELHLQSSWE